MLVYTLLKLHIYVTDLEAAIYYQTNETLAVIDSSLLAVLAAVSELQHLSPGPVAACMEVRQFTQSMNLYHLQTLAGVTTANQTL